MRFCIFLLFALAFTWVASTKTSLGAYKLKLITFLQYVGKALFKKVCIFETAAIVFFEYRKVRNLVRHI